MTAGCLNGTDAESTPLRPQTYGDPADAYYHKLFIKTTYIHSTVFVINIKKQPAQQ